MSRPRYGEKVLRKDWWGKVTVGTDGSFTPIPIRHHRLCSTCVGEYDRHTGYFESKMRRELVGKIERLPSSQITDIEESCCNCGARATIEAIFEMEPTPRVCDGLHEDFYIAPDEAAEDEQCRDD